MSKKSPQLRFEGFTDDWEERKLSEGTSKIGDGLHGTPNYSDNGDVFFINGNNLVNGKIVITKETKLVTESNQSKDDKLLNMDTILMSINGTIGNLAWYNNERVMLGKSAAYLTVSNFDKKFIFSYLQTSTIKNYFLNNLTGTTIKNLGLKTIRDTTLFVPTLEEQQKIGSLFKQLDDTIALHQRQLENYKELKKLMLQKIFNRELCFKDENGNDYPEWEEIALKELGETFTGLSGKTKENFGKGKGKFVTYMNVFSNPIANLAMTENVEIKDGEKQNEVCYGDIFFTTSSETPDEVGMSSVWLSHESNVYLNSFCFGYRLNSESESKVISQFLGAQLRAEHIRKEIVLLAQGSTRFNISKAKLIEIPLYLPVIQEQQKIADFLSMLDVRIEQLSQKVELLKEQKKGLIQQMFV